MKTIHPLLKILLLLSAFSNFAQAFYDPGQGRWLSRDPIEEEGGVNLYGFVYNDSINIIDLHGREPLKFNGHNGGFRVNPTTVDDAINPALGDNIRNIPFQVAGYDADYFPDPGEDCENIKLIQVISYAGVGDNYGPELDNDGKDKKKSPGYIESGGASSQSGHPGGIFDAPMNDNVIGRNNRPLGKGTYYLEICAVCCPDTNTERILGCVRFDFDSPTGGITPGVGGAERTPEEGFTAPALSGPTRHYRNGRWR
jgi:hypothetical protein